MTKRDNIWTTGFLIAISGFVVEFFVRSVIPLLVLAGSGCIMMLLTLNKIWPKVSGEDPE